MSAQNIIELGFNIDELTAEKKQVLDLFVDLFGKLQEYDGTKFNPLGNGGLADLKKSLTDGAQAMASFSQTAQKYNEVVTQQAQKQAAGTKTTSDLSAAMKESQRIIDQLATAQAKNTAASGDTAQALASEREALRQRNAELKTAAQLQAAEEGSINQAKAANAQLTIERNKQNTATDEGRAKIAELNAEIDKNNEVIRENSDAMKQRQINIGNYAESLSPAFASVKEQLEGINAQMAAMEQKAQGVQNYGARTVVQGLAANQHRNSGPTDFASGGANAGPVLAEDTEGYAKLAVQKQILLGLTQREAVGFKTANQEMRAVKNTLDALAIAGGENTEVFEKLNTAYTTTEQKVKDLHREQAILESDAPALTALTGVARGLGGAYELGAGAAALFADGNEKVEKELNKLVAIMTFLQGLEEATAALKSRNAIVEALEAEATKALNFVKAIEVSLFGESKIAQAADTAAKEANAAATAEGMASTEANTVAVEAEASATEVATEATIGLKTALVGVGIGAVIIAVGFLVAKIIEWNNADEKAIKLQGDLADITKKLNETIASEIELLARSNKDQIDGLKEQLSLMDAAGLNREKEFALKTKVAQLDKEQADKAIASATQSAFIEQTILGNLQFQAQKKQELADLNDRLKRHDIDVLSYSNQLAAINTKYNDDQVTQENALARSRDYHQQQYKTSLIELHSLEEAQANDVAAKRRVPESLTSRIEAIQKVVEYQKDATDKIDALIELGKTTTNAVEVQKTEIAAFNEEERRKIVLANANVEADYIKSKNAIVLADDRSTLDQRIAALKSNAEQEKKVAEAQKNDVISNPGSSDADKTLAIQKAGEEEKKITDSTQAEIYKTIVDWNDKKLQFLNDISKNELDGDAAIQKAISDNGTKQLDVRLSALQKNIDDRTQAIAGDYSLQLKLAIEHNKTQEEFDKIESDRTKALAELTANVQKEIYDITLSWGEKRLKAIEDQDKEQNSVNDVSAKYNRESDALDKGLSTNLFSILTYNEKRKKLDEQYAIDSADAQVKDDQKKLQDLKDYQEKYLDIQAALANGQLEVAKGGGNSDKIAKAQAEVDAITKVQGEGASAISALIKKQNSDIDADNNAHNAKTKSAATFLYQTLGQLAQKSEEFAISLVEDSYEKRIQSLERLTELQDAASDEEIAAVSKSTLSTRQQAEEETILTAQKTARDTAAKKQERADKIADAKFDQDAAVAKVIWGTAAAILRTYEEYGFTPLGIAAEAALAAIGAIEVATILSKPLPTYAEGVGIPGRGRHAGGEAIVGEEGPELVSIPGRQPFVVDQATLIDLAPDSKVQPLNRGIVSDLSDIGMMRGFAILNAHAASDNSVERAINNQTTRLERALKKSQRKTINQIVIPGEYAGLGRDYYETKILGKRK